MNYEKYKNCNRQKLSGLLVQAATQGDMELVKFVLTSPSLSCHADIHTQNDAAIIGSCYSGNNELSKYMLASPELSKHANIDVLEDFFVQACQFNNMDMVSFLLTDKRLVKHINIHAQNERGLLNAIRSKNFNLVEYLLTSPELSEHADHTAQGVHEATFHSKNRDIVEFFIQKYDAKYDKQILDIKNSTSSAAPAIQYEYGNIINFITHEIHIIKERELLSHNITKSNNRIISKL